VTSRRHRWLVKLQVSQGLSPDGDIWIYLRSSTTHRDRVGPEQRGFFMVYGTMLILRIIKLTTYFRQKKKFRIKFKLASRKHMTRTKRDKQKTNIMI